MNKPSFSARSVAHGFSLIELMVTVAIFAVLIVAAVPSMINLIKDSRLATHTDLLVSSLNTGRLEAIRQRKNFQACPSTAPDTANACSANAADWAGGWIVIDQATDVVQRIQAKTGITVSTTAHAVIFNGTLGNSPTAVFLTLCAPGRRQQQVHISLSGHVSKKNLAAICPD